MGQQNIKKKTRVFSSIDEAYKETLPKLISIAQAHLYNRDEGIDVAHEAFEKALEYVDKNRGKQVNISYYLLVRTVLRLCRKYNKRISIEVPYDFRGQERQATILAENLFKESN